MENTLFEGQTRGMTSKYKCVLAAAAAVAAATTTRQVLAHVCGDGHFLPLEAIAGAEL